MRVRVLGSAAGGGFPQWNCGCENCRLARSGSSRAQPRTQDSVAVSADGNRWFLLNCSPDIHRQIEAAPELQPRAARHSPIAGVVLSNGDLDHVLGLLLLRESQPLTVFATERVWRGLVEHNAVMRTLERFDGQLTFRPLALGREVALADGLSLVAHAAAGKPPLHLAGTLAPSPEDNVALLVSSRGRTLGYASSVARLDDTLVAALRECHTILFDGTFFTSDELVSRGLGRTRAEEMAHLPVSESLACFADVRRIYTHVNNSNPILVEDSPERRRVVEAGWQVAHDGMELGE